MAGRYCVHGNEFHRKRQWYPGVKSPRNENPESRPRHNGRKRQETALQKSEAGGKNGAGCSRMAGEQDAETETVGTGDLQDGINHGGVQKITAAENAVTVPSRNAGKRMSRTDQPENPAGSGNAGGRNENSRTKCRETRKRKFQVKILQW